MKIENEYYIGLSSRTNREGAKQFEKIVNKYGYSCSLVPLTHLLHLKSGVTYIGDNNLIISGELIGNPIFNELNLIIVDKDESYATNCIRINDYVLIAEGFKKLGTSITSLGYKILEVNVSEFRKMDGGLSCLSIRF